MKGHRENRRDKACGRSCNLHQPDQIKHRQHHCHHHQHPHQPDQIEHRRPEVRFVTAVTAVTAGGSVKFLPAV